MFSKIRRAFSPKKDERKEEPVGVISVQRPIGDKKAGDIKHYWNSENEFEIGLARKVFDECKAKNYLIYKLQKDGTQGEKITTFDPDAESIICSPPLKGG